MPGKDYKLVNTIVSKDKFSTIKIEDKNTNLYRMVYCRVRSATQDSIVEFDEDGMAVLPFEGDSIDLLSDLCPERISLFALNTSSAVYTFNFQPWILEVFFDQNKFHYADGYFEGKHPLLDDKIYRFEKEAADQ